MLNGKWLVVTRHNSKPARINTEMITAYWPRDDDASLGTVIWLADGRNLTVKELYNDIAATLDNVEG